MDTTPLSLIAILAVIAILIWIAIEIRVARRHGAIERSDLERAVKNARTTLNDDNRYIGGLLGDILKHHRSAGEFSSEPIELNTLKELHEHFGVDERGYIKASRVPQGDAILAADVLFKGNFYRESN